MGLKSKPPRRDLLQAGRRGAAALLASPASAVAAPPSDSPQIYTRIGVKPFINLTATYTINGGALMLPEVREAMDAASHWSVNLDELMEKAGARIAERRGSDDAVATPGAGGALTHPADDCVAEGAPDQTTQLPNGAGLKGEVIMPRQTRPDCQ